MVAHGARSLLVKLLDMKMWDGSLIKYYISILVCPAERIFCEILISHSLKIFWIHRILLHGGKPWPKKEFEFASRWGKLESSLFLLLPTSRRQYHHRLHRLLRQFFSTLSGKYSRIVASSQQNHLGCAGRLCRSVVIGRSLSVVVIVLFRTMTTINFDRSNASSLKSTIDRGLG